MSLGNIFVVALRDIPLDNGEIIYKDDVGIIKAGAESIFFIRLWQDVTLSPKDYQIIDVTKTGDGYPKRYATSAINY